MTLPPHKLGDMGQRFQIEAEGYPEDGWNIIGWTNARASANQMAEAILKAPGCTDAKVVDRRPE